MKTSIFDMTLTLPPLIEMTEVEKGATVNTAGGPGMCTRAPLC